MENLKNKRKKITTEMLFDIIKEAYNLMKDDEFNVKSFKEKHGNSSHRFLTYLKRKGFIFVVGKNYYWSGRVPDKFLAQYMIEDFKEAQKNYRENVKLAEELKSNKKLENLPSKQELQKDFSELENLQVPTNFEVSPNEFVDLDKTPVHPALMPIEDFQKLQIDSYIRQTSNLESENEKLKSMIASKDEKIASMQEEYNELLHLTSLYKKRIKELEFYSKDNKEKRVIRLFGIRMGSIG